MPYTTPAAQSSGAVAPVSWATAVKAATDYLANPPACRVYHNANQPINDNTPTVLAFNSERYDTDTMHDTVTNNSRITLTTAGLYVVTLALALSAGTDYAYVEGRIRLNGTTNLAIQGDSSAAGGGPLFGRALTVTTIYKFAASDYVEALVYQDNVANTSRTVDAVANASPEFAATWIGLG